MTYPLFFSAAPETLEEFAMCEEGSFADNGEERPADDSHAFRIVQRHRAKIEIRSPEELAEVWYALCSGTLQVHKPRAAFNLADKMKPAVMAEAEHPAVAEVLKTWRYPSGH